LQKSRASQIGTNENIKIAEQKEQNISMSFGDSDGSMQKNSDNDQPSNKDKKSPIPKQ